MNYYTACGMSEYTSGSARVDPAEQPTSDATLSEDESPPAPVSVPPRRTLIGPFTARQVGLVNAIVVGAVLVLFVGTRPLGGDTATTIQPGASFYRISAETQGLQLGQRAPDFVGRNGDQDIRLTDLDGREIRLADFVGKPVWVVFWATWCPPCQQETPDIREVFEASRAQGLVIVAVDVQEPVDAIRRYAERYGLTYTIGADTYAAIMRTYGVFGLPTHYFIDRRGVIRDRYFGPLRRDQMEQRVDLISRS
jgi:peroxiredoxin